MVPETASVVKRGWVKWSGSVAGRTNINIGIHSAGGKGMSPLSLGMKRNI